MGYIEMSLRCRRRRGGEGREGRGGEGGELRESWEREGRGVGRGKDGRRLPFPYPFRAFLSYFALNFPIDFYFILKTF